MPLTSPSPTSVSTPVLDPDTVRLLARHPAVARAATAWLEAYEASLARGLREHAARAAADAAWDRAHLPLDNLR